MRIVLHEMGTYPHTRQLAAALASRGHEIAYFYCPSVQTPSRQSPEFGSRSEIACIPIGLGSEFAKRNFARRFVQERAYGAKAAALIARFRPELVISGNTTIEAQAPISKMCRRDRVPFVLWLQDVYSIGIRSVMSRLPIAGLPVAAYYHRLERRVAARCDGIVAIADEFRDLLLDWGIDPQRIAVIENWAVLPVGALPSNDNEWSARHGLCGKRVLLYSGTLGFKHDPSLFIELAREFADEPDVRIVVISEGHGAEWLSQRTHEFPGLVLLPFQPAVEFNNALACADVLLTILEPQAAKYSVPSKVLAYMAAGKPILASIAAENLAARTILAAGAGFVADPGSSSELRRLARLLIDDESRRTGFGAAALCYARTNFDIDEIARRFEEFFHRVAGRKPGATTHPDELRAVPATVR